jgi:solute carrier family 10 (sodium/bile acid cotransporter), member 7
MGKIRIDWFLTGLAAAVGVAWLYPLAGARAGPLPTDALVKAGVVVIFFIHGAALPREELRRGLANWRLHLLVQAWTFLVFPLLGLLFEHLARHLLSPDLLLGFFYLAALPSTIASSVLLTAAADGNVAAAVFNAVTSNLIGVVLTPAWVGWRLSQHGTVFPVGAIIANVFALLVVPLAAGQALRPLLGAWVKRHRPRLAVMDRLIIIGIVYTTFCDSFVARAWRGTGLPELGVTLAGVVALFAVAAGGIWLATRALRFARGDAIAALFCGSKKTLAAGVPMAGLIFGHYPGLSAVLLPIMLYHPLQIAFCSVLAGRFNPRRV